MVLGNDGFGVCESKSVIMRLAYCFLDGVDKTGKKSNLAKNKAHLAWQDLTLLVVCR